MNEVFNIVYIGRIPVVNSSDGLNVLLTDLIKSLRAINVSCVIHTTSRHKASIIKAMEANSLTESDYKVRDYSIDSLLLRRFAKKRTDEKKMFNFADWITSSRLFECLARYITFTLDITVKNVIFKLFLILPLFATFIIAGLLFLFCAIVMYISLKAYKIYISIKNRFIDNAYKFAKKNEKSKSLAKKLHGSFKVAAPRYFLNALYLFEQLRFAKKLSKNCTKAFFFNCFDGIVVSKFTGKSLVVFPDAVSLVYPERYISYHDKYTLQAFFDGLKSATKIVCYSNYVRDTQLSYFLNPAQISSKCVVIPQGNFCQNIQHKNFSDDIWSECKNFFPGLVSDNRKLNFANFDYIIYPTVDRPHKNLITVIRAFEILLRKKHLNLKLVLTTPNLSNEVFQYIYNSRLYYDILFFPSVSINTLECLVQNSKLMIHASVAEGGDVFNFSRAASAGVPSLLADIPVVNEMFNRHGIQRVEYEDFLFNVSNVDSLASKCENILACNAIINKQISLHEVISSYSFDDMSSLYLNEYRSLN